MSISNSNPFVKQIDPSGTTDQDNGEDSSVGQVSPSWILTFIRWTDRDTLRTKPSDSLNFSTTAPPLVVENDCISVKTVVNKGTLTASMDATLMMTDVNYETAIAPGDFVFVNMLNWPDDARKISLKAKSLKSINGINDGFKGVFKVQSVRKRLAVIDQSTGATGVIFSITGFAFTEFNNTIYFVSEMIDSADTANLLLFASNIQLNWSSLLASEGRKGLTNVQDIIKTLIELFVGTGIGNDGARDKNGIVRSPNVVFFIPQAVGQLLGVKGAKAAKDVYNYLFGIQKYSGAANSLKDGMNPSNLKSSTDSRFLILGDQCQGETITKPEYWNQVKAWSILNQFTNAPLNELFTTFRVSPSGAIMPTVVFRQIPFTNDSFDNGSYPVTRFLSLPRWKINPAMVYSLDLGRDEAARINFVQVFGKSTFGKEGYDVSDEIAHKNYLYEIDDVQRSGLRPYVINNNFDDLTENKSTFNSPQWAKVIGDALIGGHLKINGTVECQGIVEAIAVGDNLEFDGVVYHIEQVVHSSTISADGRKSFRTAISVSNGISVDSSARALKYSEMTYPFAADLRGADYDNNRILPGVSESQDTTNRKGLDSPADTPADNPKGSFTQPNTGTSVDRTGQENAFQGERDKK